MHTYKNECIYYTVTWLTDPYILGARMNDAMMSVMACDTNLTPSSSQCILPIVLYMALSEAIPSFIISMVTPFMYSNGNWAVKPPNCFPLDVIAG